MNMQKVTFVEGKDVCLAETGEKIGELRPRHDDVIDVFLNNGVHVYAYYGTIDDEGVFHIYCRNIMACRTTCVASDSPECRYNRKYAERSGYYVDVDANLSVW